MSGPARNAALIRETHALRVSDVMEVVGVGKSKAYDIMRRINRELEAEGYITISGRVPEARFREKFYMGPAKAREPRGKRVNA
jgi:hypothetical protein